MEIDFLTLFIQFSDGLSSYFRTVVSMGPALAWAMGLLGFLEREVPGLLYLARFVFTLKEGSIVE